MAKKKEELGVVHRGPLDLGQNAANRAATHLVLGRLDRALAEYQQAVKEAYAAQAAWTTANCAVLRARLEGAQPEPKLIRDYYRTLAEWNIARNREEGASEALDNVFMTASVVLGERELPGEK